MLNRATPVYEVLNFGRGGAETVDHISFLTEYVLDTRPDYILLQWFVNDVEGGNYKGRPEYMRLVPFGGLSRYLGSNSVLYYLLNSQWQTIVTP